MNQGGREGLRWKPLGIWECMHTSPETVFLNIGIRVKVSLFSRQTPEEYALAHSLIWSHVDR